MTAPASRYHRAMRAPLIGLLAAAFVFAGCTSAASSASPSSSASPTRSFSLASQQPVASPGSSPSGSAVIDLPAAFIAAVKVEIADDAGVSVNEVTIISAEALTFPDGSLGCPVPGLNYIQVQIDGFKVVGSAAGATFDYRGTSPSDITRCEKPR